MFNVVLVGWRELDEETSELAAVVQRHHQFREFVHLFLNFGA